jgi:hypothetical protein
MRSGRSPITDTDQRARLAELLQRYTEDLKADRPFRDGAAPAFSYLAERAERDQAPDPIALRRRILRRIWREHYAHLDRTPAADRIAAAWSQLEGEGEQAFVPPEGVRALLDRLRRAKIARVEKRTIIADLDPSLDRSPF